MLLATLTLLSVMIIPPTVMGISKKTLYMPLQQKKEYFLILASELPLIGPVILIQKIL